MLLRMKRTILCFLLLLSFAACHRFDGAKQSLLLIDSLSVSEPERALSLLDSMQAQSDSLPRRLRMKYHFLRVRAKDKAYQSLQSDTIMERVARYYRHHGTANEAMEATYLLGGVYRDRGESPRALDVYLSASEQADTTRPDCNYGILARIHGQMAELFEKQFLPENELEEIDKAKYFALKDKDTLLSLIFEIHKTQPYHTLHKEDSILYVAERVFQELIKLKEPSLAISCHSAAIPIYIDKGELAKARDYIYRLEESFALSSPSSRQESGIYMYKAMLNQKKNQLDSAIYFYHRQIHTDQSAGGLVYAYRNLMKIYTEKHDADSVCKYSLLYNLWNDSTSIKLNSNYYIRTKAAYKYNHLKEEGKTKQNKIYHLQTIILCFSLLVLVLAIAAMYFVRNQQIKNKEVLLAQNLKYNHLLDQYHLVQNNIKLLEISEIDKKHQLQYYQNQIYSLRIQIENLQSFTESKIEWKNVEAILSEPIILTLHKKASQYKMASFEELFALRAIINRYFPNFLIHLQSKALLSNIEINLCILIKLNFLPSEATVLLGTSKQNVSNMRARMYQKLNNKKGKSSDFDCFIKTFGS